MMDVIRIADKNTKFCESQSDSCYEFLQLWYRKYYSLHRPNAFSHFWSIHPWRELARPLCSFRFWLTYPQCMQRFCNVSETFQNCCMQRFQNRFICTLLLLQWNSFNFVAEALQKRCRNSFKTVSETLQKRCRNSFKWFQKRCRNSFKMVSDTFQNGCGETVRILFQKRL